MNKFDARLISSEISASSKVHQGWDLSEHVANGDLALLLICRFGQVR